MRLFTAITIPEEIKSRLRDLLIPIDGVKWQEKSQMHLTLRFIGEVDEEMKQEIIGELNNVKAKPFSISIGKCGSFPPKDNGNPKVIWVGVQENESLSELQGRIEQACRGAGLEPDERSFKPHITLGRNKGADANEIRSFMENMTVPDFEPVHIGQFYLFRSELSSKGAKHYVEEKFSLQ